VATTKEEKKEDFSRGRGQNECHPNQRCVLNWLFSIWEKPEQKVGKKTWSAMLVAHSRKQNRDLPGRRYRKTVNGVRGGKESPGGENRTNLLKGQSDLPSAKPGQGKKKETSKQHHNRQRHDLSTWRRLVFRFSQWRETNHEHKKKIVNARCPRIGLFLLLRNGGVDVPGRGRIRHTAREFTGLASRVRSNTREKRKSAHVKKGNKSSSTQK